MQKYVAGFLGVNGPSGSVVLIKKNKPEWQVGLLNGVGGKIKRGEKPSRAMHREFYEETGLNISDWIPFLILDGPGLFPKWRVYFFKKMMEGRKLQLWQMTGEKVAWFSAKNIQNLKTIDNLKWIVPMALNPVYHVIRAKEMR